MNATKRKFNNLIQGLGTRPSQPPTDHVDDLDDIGAPTSDDPMATTPSPLRRTATPDSMAGTRTPRAPVSSLTAELLSKRRRTAVPNSPVEADENESTIRTIVSNVTVKTWSPRRTASGAVAREPPRYCPSDRDQLIRRLSTFQELTEWTPKPDKVNEIEWAKRGWVCVGKERVRCTLCHKELVVKTNKREVDGREVPLALGSEVEQALVDRFAALIVEAHQEDCLWARQGCDDSLLRLSLTNPQTALPSFRQRYDELCARPNFLPYEFNLRLPPTLFLETVRSQLPPKFFTEPPPPSTNPSASVPNRVALALALTGWQGLNNPRIGAVPNSASCATCLRRLGLWMFKSKEVDPETKEVIIPAPMDHLDPIREHRFFCPWRNPAAQRNSGSKPNDGDNKAAWEVLEQTIRNSAYLRNQAGGKKGAALAHSRSKSNIVPGTLTPTKDTAAARRGSSGQDDATLEMLTSPHPGDDEGDDGQREDDDKKRWARLRRVKSLFGSQNGKKMRRSLSRPGSTTPGPQTEAGTPTTLSGHRDSSM